MSESKKYITALPSCSPVIIVSLSSAASNYAASANTGLGLIAHYTLHNWEHDKLDPVSWQETEGPPRETVQADW